MTASSARSPASRPRARTTMLFPAPVAPVMAANPGSKSTDTWSRRARLRMRSDWSIGSVPSGHPALHRVPGKQGHQLLDVLHGVPVADEQGVGRLDYHKVLHAAEGARAPAADAYRPACPDRADGPPRDVPRPVGLQVQAARSPSAAGA